MPREGEGAHDEAVGVHHVLGDGPQVRVSVLHTGDVDPIADVLHRGDQQAAHQEDQGGDAIVKLGDDALYLRVCNLQIFIVQMMSRVFLFSSLTWCDIFTRDLRPPNTCNMASSWDRQHRQV